MLVFSCLSQTICVVPPAVFIKIARSLLASVQFKPILRRAVGCLPERLCECLEICLLAPVMRGLSRCLLCPRHPCRSSAGRSRGWIPPRCRPARGSPVSVGCTRGGSTAKAASRWRAAMRKGLFSEGPARVAASPGPASDPNVSLQILLGVSKPLMGRSPGDTRWPYLPSL